MIEDIFNKDDALIEAASLKLVEEIQTSVKRYRNENAQELEKIRDAHKQLIEALEKEETSIKEIVTTLEGLEGEATDQELDESVRLTDWAKKEESKLVRREKMEARNFKNHKQYLDEASSLSQGLKNRNLLFQQKIMQRKEEEEEQKALVVVVKEEDSDTMKQA